MQYCHHYGNDMQFLLKREHCWQCCRSLSPIVLLHLLGVENQFVTRNDLHRSVELFPRLLTINQNVLVLISNDRCIASHLHEVIIIFSESRNCSHQHFSEINIYMAHAHQHKNRTIFFIVRSCNIDDELKQKWHEMTLKRMAYGSVMIITITFLSFWWEDVIEKIRGDVGIFC